MTVRISFSIILHSILIGGVSAGYDNTFHPADTYEYDGLIIEKFLYE